MTTYTLRFPWRTPPLTANQRLFWAAKADITRTTRNALAIAAQYAEVPAMGRCRVVLTWHVNTKHRRDEDNVYPTLKAACDGIVDAGVVPDDTPQYMEKLSPVIRYDKDCQPHITVTITEIAVVAA